MNQPFVCPLCGNRNVTFSGTKGYLSIRSHHEWVAVLVCENSHTFCVLLSDASSVPGLEGRRFRNIRQTIAHSQRLIHRSNQLIRGMTSPPPSFWEPDELTHLRSEAQDEKDPKKLAKIIDQMNKVLTKYESMGLHRPH